MFEGALLLVAATACITTFVAASRSRRSRDELVELRGIVLHEISRSAAFAATSDLLSAAFDTATDGVMVGNLVGEFVVTNEIAKRYTTGHHGEVLLLDTCLAMLVSAIKGESSQQELVTFGQSKQVVSVRSEPVEVDGQLIGAVVVISDITEQRHLVDVRTDFVANVSHELRTPIGALALLAETMVDEADVVVMREFAERMVRESDRLARIVDDLLELSRLDAGLPEDRTVEEVRGLVTDAIDLVASAAEAASISIEVRQGPGDTRVVVTRRQVVSAIFNLLDNAVKYSERGSTIDVSIAAVGSDVLIAVRDQGDGIPTRDLDRIFERFYRVDRARSRGTGGTGLGLSIVRRIVEAHDGEVTVSAHEGEGSTFTLRFPVANAPQHDSARA